MIKKRSPKYAIILESAIKLSEKIGRENLTLQNVSECSGVTIPSIVFHFKSMGCLRESVLGEAMRLDNECIVLEALMFNKIKKNNITDSLKEKIVRWVRKLCGEKVN